MLCRTFGSIVAVLTLGPILAVTPAHAQPRRSKRYNASFSFAGGPIDGRWDAAHTHPDVRDWWLAEITEENGYVLE